MAIYETSQFRKDFKKLKKQGKQIEPHSMKESSPRPDARPKVP
jgi:hypothetical protein